MRIAIIGAGPSGLLSCQHLLDQTKDGRTVDITVFGDPSNSQSKTVVVGGVPCDVGTCYFHPGYTNSVIQLAQKLGTTIEYPPPSQVWDGEQYRPMSTPGVGDLLRTSLFLVHSLLWNVLRSVPSVSDWLYGRSMVSYLSAVGLGSLSTSFIFSAGTLAQGYGPMEDVSAHRLFRWLQPAVFTTPLASRLLGTGTGMIKGGYEALFERLYATVTSAPTVQADLRLVQRVHTGGQVDLQDGTTLHFDQVLVCCPLQELQTPLALPRTLVEHTNAYSFLWTSKSACPDLDHRAYMRPALERQEREGILTFRREGVTPDGEHIYWGFGSDGRPRVGETLAVTETRVRAKFVLEAAALGVPVQTVSFFRSWRYNPRLSSAAIRAGWHRRIQDAQGVGNVWYLGGMTSHWDIDSIYEDSLSKIRHLLRRG